MAPFMKIIRPDDWTSIRRGRYVIVMAGQRVPIQTPYGPLYDAYANQAVSQENPLGGAIVKVNAVAPPFVAGVLAADHTVANRGTYILLDLRKYGIGYVPKSFVSGLIGKHEDGETKGRRTKKGAW